MHTVSLGRHKFFQPFEQLSFIRKIAQDYNSGQIKVFSLSQIWTIYLEDGKVVYGCLSNGMWELFYRKLQEFSQQIPALNNQVYSQLKMIFGSAANDPTISNPDYMAICWLMNREYFNLSQAAKFIAAIVIEVMELFVTLRDGIYEFASESSLTDLQKFYHLDISFLMARCQEQNGQKSELQAINGNGSKNVAISNFKQNIATLDTPRQKSYTATKEYISEISQEIQQINKPQLPKLEPKLYKILCIDDSPTIIKAIQGFLDEELFEVIGINDSLKALMQILRTKPDVILLDISMPNLDGYELCSLLRKHPSFRYTPVVMVTAKTSFIDKARAKLVKSSGYLTKPFTKFDLLKTVFQQLNDKATVYHG